MTLPCGLGFLPGRIARQMLGLFGYRFIADELPARGISAGENKAALVAFSKYQFLHYICLSYFVRNISAFRRKKC